MNAAVVTSFEKPPSYATSDAPVAAAGEVLVSLDAAALSPLVRSHAAGRHYSSPRALPFISGIDGVGRLADGRRVYFAFPRAPFGAMGEVVPVRADLCASIPDEVDSATAAAIANPGMSSWAALAERAHLERGESVLINGATGVSGRLAVQIAKHLGARTVIATGRNPATLAALPELGADLVIPLDTTGDEAIATFRSAIRTHGVNVIVDYLWGPSAEALIAAIGGGGSRSGEPRIRYVQVGASSGASIHLDGGKLRSSGLELLGSGIGSVADATFVRIIGALMQAVVPAHLRIATALRPLAQVATAWNEDVGDRRLVFEV